MTAVTLYAWAVPAYYEGSAVDHTWVTTYDNRLVAYPAIPEVVAAGQNYWYCWGDFHAKGETPSIPDGFLASGAAELSYASCLCQPDADSRSDAAARGTIFFYGIDGVCHQLANQVLWPTGQSGAPPATVHKARGYWLSNAIFGTYGKQHAAWANRQTTCAGSSGSNVMSTEGTHQEVDDFEAHVRTALKGRETEDKIRSLIERRRTFVAAVEQLKYDSPDVSAPSAADLNRLYSIFFHEAERIVGGENFKLVFGVSAQVEMNIVDPAIYESALRQRGKR